MQTFLEATKLTTIPLRLVYLAISVRHTSVDSLVLDSSLEESFASFTSDDPVMETSCLVFTNIADHGLVVLLDHSIGRFIVIKV